MPFIEDTFQSIRYDIIKTMEDEIETLKIATMIPQARRIINLSIDKFCREIQMFYQVAEQSLKFLGGINNVSEDEIADFILFSDKKLKEYKNKPTPSGSEIIELLYQQLYYVRYFDNYIAIRINLLNNPPIDFISFKEAENKVNCGIFKEYHIEKDLQIYAYPGNVVITFMDKDKKKYYVKGDLHGDKKKIYPISETFD